MEIYYRDNYEINLLSAEEYEHYKDRIPHINCWWWLRSPGDYSDFTAGIDDNGSVDFRGCRIDYVNGAVRPVLKISDGRKCKIGERVMLYSFPWIMSQE